jgi:hypothetical protein
MATINAMVCTTWAYFAIWHLLGEGQMSEQQPDLPFARPMARTWWDTDIMVECPVCGHKDNIDEFDCLGADEGCVFCNHCQTEIRL